MIMKSVNIFNAKEIFSYECQIKMSIEFCIFFLTGQKMQGILEINKISRHTYLVVNSFQNLLGYIVKSIKTT